VPECFATAKVILYILRRWSALTRYLDDGALPIDNTWVESRIPRIAVGRNN
jgi:transposase